MIDLIDINTVRAEEQNCCCCFGGESDSGRSSRAKACAEHKLNWNPHIDRVTHIDDKSELTGINGHQLSLYHALDTMRKGTAVQSGHRILPVEPNSAAALSGRTVHIVPVKQTAGAGSWDQRLLPDMLHLAGWFDSTAWGALNAFYQIEGHRSSRSSISSNWAGDSVGDSASSTSRLHGRGAGAGQQGSTQFLLIGPWTHGGNQVSQVPLFNYFFQSICSVVNFVTHCIRVVSYMAVFAQHVRTFSGGGVTLQPMSQAEILRAFVMAVRYMHTFFKSICDVIFAVLMSFNNV